MKLFFIYGPPAAGKLTIAEELSKQTGVALFHNHLTRNLVRDIYGDKLRENYQLVDMLRNNIIAYCAQHDTDLIFTFVYEGETDDQTVKSHIKSAEIHGGEVIFIELTAERKDLLNRVSSEKRKSYKKLTDPVRLAEIVQDMDKYKIPYVRSIKINTSENSVKESVKKILNAIKNENKYE